MFAYIEKDRDYFDFRCLSEIDEEKLGAVSDGYTVEYMYETPEYPIGVYVWFKGITKSELCSLYNKAYNRNFDALPEIDQEDFDEEKHGGPIGLMDWIGSFDSQLIVVTSNEM